MRSSLQFFQYIILLLALISNGELFARSQFTLPPDELFSEALNSSKLEEEGITQIDTSLPDNKLEEVMQLSVRSSKSSYKIGENLSLEVKTNKDCYLTIIDIGSSGNAYILYPNSYQQNNLIKIGDLLKIPNQHFDIQIGEPAGTENIWAICRVDNEPVIPQGYTFKKNIFISLGKMSSIYSISNLPKNVIGSEEARKYLSFRITR